VSFVQVEQSLTIHRKTLWLARLEQVAHLVLPLGTVSEVGGDSTDGPILDAATSVQVDYVVTSDQRVLAVKECAGVKIVTDRNSVRALDWNGRCKRWQR